MKYKCKKLISMLFMIMMMISSLSFCAFAANSTSEIDLSAGNPYYKLWNNKFLVYVDNYSGDVNNVSAKDLNAGKGTSRVYIFSKLSDGDYTAKMLLEDIKNSDVSTNLHDSKPILVHLPKTAKNFESHLKFQSDDEKGKLFSGGPYSKYSTKENGFYYQDKLLKEDEVNKVLTDYKKKADEIDKRIKALKTFSIKDLYPEAGKVYLTNGATTLAGTNASIIYDIDANHKFSPYDMGIVELKKASSKTYKGAATNNLVPEWEVETIYILSADGKTLIKKMSIYDLKNELWSKQ